MSQTDKKATATADIGAGLDKGFRELALLSFAAAALFYLISLLTFNLEDAGWTHSDGPRITNNAGAVGAWLADFSLSMVGLMAYAFPVLLTILGYSIYRQGHQLIWRNPLTLVFRVAGFVLFIAVGAALADIYWTPSAIRWIHADLALPQSSGGILGEEVAGKLLAAFGSKGTLILLVFSLLAGISLYTGISWLTAVDALGKYTLLVVEGIFSLLSKLSHVEPPAPDAGEPEEETAATPVEPAPPPAKKDKSKPAAARIEPVLASPLPMEDEEEEYRHEEPAKPEKTTEQASSKVEPLNTPAPNPDPTPAQVQDPTPRHAAAPAPVPEAKPQTMAMPQAVKKIKPSELPPIAPGELPTLDLLTQQVAKPKGYTQEALDSMSRLVESILSDFGVEVEVVGVHPGPVITRFEVQPAPGVKASRISGLAKDLARALSVTSVRVVEIIPGKSVIGLEIPNEAREIVLLYEVLASDVYAHADSPLTMVLGKDISGLPVIANLARMPHLLVAGTTGSGKSVAVNVMILSMLYKARPDEVRMIMIDPKMLELSIYEGIPHLLTPVVTDMKEAANALRWSVAEMERRYKLMSMLGVRNLAGYNQKIREAEEAGEPIPDPMWNPNMTLSEEDGPPVLGHLPFIVIVIDELADMMMIVGKKVEELIARLAQKARAAGIHLILATQRPSVDVLTGLIKANIPTRLSFQVSSRIDSRTIIDQGGAETLLGNGDMLFLPPGTGIPMRAHGAFVSDQEVHNVVEFLKRTGKPNYIDEITRFSEDGADATGGFKSMGGEGGGEESDALYDEAVRFVTESRKASISSVQRRFKVGYNRAARMIEDMERAGIVGPAETNGSRSVLVPPPPDI